MQQSTGRRLADSVLTKGACTSVFRRHSGISGIAITLLDVQQRQINIGKKIRAAKLGVAFHTARYGRRQDVIPATKPCQLTGKVTDQSSIVQPYPRSLGHSRDQTPIWQEKI